MHTPSHPFNSDSHTHLQGAISPQIARALADDLAQLLENDQPSCTNVKELLERTSRVGSKEYNPKHWAKDDEYMLHFAGGPIFTQLEAIAAEKIFVLDGTPRRIRRVLGLRRDRQTRLREVLCEFLVGRNVGTEEESWSAVAAAGRDWLPFDEVAEVVPGLVEEIEP